jgi:hypothetical protein
MKFSLAHHWRKLAQIGCANEYMALKEIHWRKESAPMEFPKGAPLAQRRSNRRGDQLRPFSLLPIMGR